MSIENLKYQIYKFKAIFLSGYSHTHVLSVDYIETRFKSTSCSEKPKIPIPIDAYSCPCHFWKKLGWKLANFRYVIISLKKLKEKLGNNSIFTNKNQQLKKLVFCSIISIFSLLGAKKWILH